MDSEHLDVWRVLVRTRHDVRWDAIGFSSKDNAQNFADECASRGMEVEIELIEQKVAALAHETMPKVTTQGKAPCAAAT